MMRSSANQLVKAAAHLASVRARLSDTWRYTPRRAVLYVPGCDERKRNKALRLPAVDCVVLDCEDGVAVSRKDEARESIRHVLDSDDSEWRRPSLDLCARVNAVQCGQMCERDLEAVLSARQLPNTLMLPKVDCCDHVEWLFDRIHQCLSLRQRNNNDAFTKDQAGGGRCYLNVVLFCESAISLLSLADIATSACLLSSQRGSSGPSILLDGLVLGSDDYCADIGAVRSPDCGEILLARQQLVAVARSVRVQAIDAVFINYRDTEALRREARQAAGWGFTGKQVIHPCQVEPVQLAFSPSAEQLAWAEQLLAAFAEHEQAGRGAFTFRDQMIDMPLVNQARNIVRTHRAVPHNTTD